MSGYALNGEGREVSNMGIAAGDYENNGHLDLVNTDFSDDSNVVFHNDGSGEFDDVSASSGLAGPTYPLSASAMAFSTTTTTAGKICWWSTDMSIRKWISTPTGA